MKSQNERILEVLLDNQPHRSDEIMQRVLGAEHLGLFRLSARIFDLREKYEIIGYKDPEHKSLYIYRLVGPKVPQMVLAI